MFNGTEDDDGEYNNDGNGNDMMGSDGSSILNGTVSSSSSTPGFDGINGVSKDKYQELDKE